MRSIQTSITKLAACSALAFGACAAHADLYNFSLSGAYTASWQLDSAPTPNIVFNGAWFTNVSGTFENSDHNVVDLRFYDPTVGGGLQIWDNTIGLGQLYSAKGQQIYSGTDQEPIFSVGSYDMTGYDGQHYVLTISADTPSNDVPEPETYALLLGAAGAMALAMRRRSKKA